MTADEQTQQSAHDAMWEAWDKYMAIEDAPGASREAIEAACEAYREKRAVYFAMQKESKP